MPWLEPRPVDRTHRCRKPWMLFHRTGSRWQCPVCHRVWVINLIGMHDPIRAWQLECT